MSTHAMKQSYLIGMDVGSTTAKAVGSRAVGTMPGTRLSAAGMSTAMPMPWKTRTMTIGAGGPVGAARPVSSMSEAMAKGDLAAAQREFERMAQQFDQKAKDGTATPEEMRQAAEALKQMAQALEGSRADAAVQQLKEGAEKLEKASAEVQRLQQQMAQASTPEERAAAEERIRSIAKEVMSSAST